MSSSIGPFASIVQTIETLVKQGEVSPKEEYAVVKKVEAGWSTFSKEQQKMLETQYLPKLHEKLSAQDLKEQFAEEPLFTEGDELFMELSNQAEELIGKGKKATPQEINELAKRITANQENFEPYQQQDLQDMMQKLRKAKPLS
ncbi:MAG: hypothetical protein H0X51_03745 [Parachlamydiaceae bacterium]|nr:hypothetical protein [Parachlamydiaceae bacterium]